MEKRDMKHEILLGFWKKIMGPKPKLLSELGKEKRVSPRF